MRVSLAGAQVEGRTRSVQPQQRQYGCPQRIRIDLEPLHALGVCRWLQQVSPQRHHLGVTGGDVIDVEIEVLLLRLAVGPV